MTIVCLQEALQAVQPSAKREGFATVPDVSWEDVGALENIREELSLAIMVCSIVVSVNVRSRHLVEFWQ